MNKLEEALMEKDRAIRRENDLLKTIDKLETTIKNIKTETSNQYTKIIENTRSKHQLNIKSKDAEMNEIVDKVILLENTNDKLQRKNKSLKIENNKF